MITDGNIRAQVLTALAGSEDDFDVEGIVRDVVSLYGLVSIDTLTAAQWESLLLTRAR